MAVIINASTSTGLVQSADTSGQINIQSNGTTVLGVTSTGTSVTGTQSVSGNLSFNSGYGSSAVAYGCRAWVNFNGTGTVAINASGNVTSITDNGTGNYTVNFTTAMPDDDYGACYEGLSDNADNNFTADACGTLTTNGTVQTRSTTAIRFNVKNSSMSSFDPATMSCMIFR
jgi:hypothetical protein